MKTQTAEALAKGLKAAFCAVVVIVLGKKGYEQWVSSKNSDA